MQHQEKYTLHWHSYSDHLREALNEMMISSEFADVTLVTDDKQQIRAHRNILSACSPVFKSILQIDSKNANPVIYLRGIQHSEMESIMQFIYLGEARFYEERMNEFIKVSKDLEIKDLSTGIEMNDQAEDRSNEDNNLPENNYADEEVSDNPAQTFDQTKTATRIITNNAAIKKLSSTDGGKYTCNHCDYQAGNQSHLTTHIQSQHEGVKYACNQCDYHGSKDALRMHLKIKHNI